MNPLMRTWRVVRASRQAGPPPTPGDGASYATTGEEWVMRLCRQHFIDPDDLVEIHADLCDSTVPNLLTLTDELSTEDLIGAAIAAGMTNGLALGLAHAGRARASW